MFVIGRVRGNSSRICARSTDIVIEGYPRSANTYAVACMRYWSRDSLIIASHQHSIAQLKLASMYRIPAIVLIRPPMDAILSLKIRRPEVSTEALTKEYFDFHKKIVPMTKSVVIADFQDVVKDFGEIVKQVNIKFGVSLPFSKIDAESKIKIEKIIDEMDLEDRIKSGSRYGQHETHVARHNEKRAAFPHADEYRNQISKSIFYPSACNIYAELKNMR